MQCLSSSGCVSAIIVGVLLGLSFTPATYVQDNFPNVSKHGE